MGVPIQQEAAGKPGTYRYSDAKSRYSMLGYLQERTTEAAARLPASFATLREWESYKADFLPRLASLLGFPERAPMRSELLDSRHVNQYVRERVDYHFDGTHYVACHVIRPAHRVSRTLPVIVISPGWFEDKWAATYNHIAERWAEAGFITLIPDHAPFGESDDGSTQAAMISVMGTGMAIGMPYEALRAFELMRAVDYLVTRDDVDPERIGIAGLCQGSIDLWWAATFEPRFKAIAPVCGTTTYEAWAREMIHFRALGDASPYVPGLLHVCDTQHIYASWAPRPVLIQNNINDNWWPLSGFDQVVELSAAVFGLHGCPERFAAYLDNQVHDITPLFESRLLSFFRDWLC